MGCSIAMLDTSKALDCGYRDRCWGVNSSVSRRKQRLCFAYVYLVTRAAQRCQLWALAIQPLPGIDGGQVVPQLFGMLENPDVAVLKLVTG